MTSFLPIDQAKNTQLLGTLIQCEKEASVYYLSLPEGEVNQTANFTITDAHSHLVLHAERGSVSTVFLELASEVDAQCAIEIFVEDEATLRCVFVHHSSGNNVSISQKAKLGNGAVCNWQNTTLCTGEVTHTAEAVLDGHDAVSDMDWIFYAKDTEKLTLSAVNTFTDTNGGGEIILQGVAEHTAHVTCNGLINIDAGGTGTDTYLTESVLMLDPSSKVDAIPGLEIKTNDVKASHSATVSRVTEEDLYYFAARGIPAYEARAMYILGFIGERLDALENESHRERITTLLGEKYGASTGI